MTIVSGLLVFLAVLISDAWSGIGKTTVDLVARGQLAQEIDIATSSLSHDLSGNLPMPASLLTGTQQAGKLLDWRPSLTDPQVLELCYDGGSNPNNIADWLNSADTVVQYSLDSSLHALIRTQLCNGATVSVFTVARNVDDFTFSLDGDDNLHIVLTFGCYYSWDTGRTKPIVKRTCKFAATR